MHPEDNVAISLREMKAGDKLIAVVKGKKINIEVKEAIPLGHKIALSEIKKNGPVIKYGETIGLAKSDISVGFYVHVHNLSDY